MRHVHGTDYELIDLGGGTLYPGFIDTHSHLSLYCSYLSQIHCGIARGSIAAVLDALRAKAAEPGTDVILGYGYDDTGIADKRHLTRHDLDSVCTHRPVFIAHISGHLAYANTPALRMFGLSASSSIPGGEVVLDE